MDISEYLPMFLAEGREHLQELNLAVVRIEEHPDDQDTVDEIFRIAHSLKGMSATMGFAGMAALTHEMEDVFELLRQRKRRPARATRSTSCSSAWTRCPPPSTRSTRPARRQIEPEPLIERLQGLIRERDAEQEAASAPARHRRPPTSPSWPTAAASCRSASTLADDVQIPSVRAYMVLSALAELGETLACIPTPDDVDGLRRHARSTPGWSPSAPTPSWPPSSAPCPTSRRSSVFEAVADAARRRPDEAVARGRRPGAATRRGRAARARRPHSKGSSTVRVDAERLDQLMHFMGELVLHRTQVEALAADADVPGPLAGDAEPDPHLARPAGDGHAGPDDPGRGRLPALPAAGARPLDQARQAGRAGARRQGHRARPHRGRRARRPARAPRSATRSTTASRGRRSASRPASRPTGTLDDLRPPRRRQRGHQVARRRPRHRPGARSPARPPSAG